MAKGLANDTVLYRTEKWELKANEAQTHLLVGISDGLREIYNWGHEIWMTAYEEYRKEKKASPGMKPATKLPTFYDQVNELTALGEEDRKAGLARARIPRNWKEETLDALHGALKSFFELVKKGDPDHRPPRLRSEKRFSAIPGRSGFSIKRGRVVLASNIFGADTLSFPIPAEYQAGMLARATRFKKFVISRDEPNLAKPGRFWISVSYEIPKPEQQPFVPEEAVYVALGASHIGIVSPHGEEVVSLWRPDAHWKPKTDDIEASLKATYDDPAFRPIQKGSCKWRRLRQKREKMFGIMGAQQKQDRREVVALDLLEKVADGVAYGHGVHFVVTDLVVRSKEGKLADASKEERGGPLGRNWAAQNTGALGYLVEWLEQKAPEYGGTVRKHKLPYTALPDRLPDGPERKILIARALRDDFLRSLNEKQAA